MSDAQIPSGETGEVAGMKEALIVAEETMASYGLDPETVSHPLEPVGYGTFLMKIDPLEGSRSLALRVHDDRLTSRREIDSELSWLEALRLGSNVRAPVARVNAHGQRVTTVRLDGVERHASLLELPVGSDADPFSVGIGNFVTLGAVTARLHLQAHRWKRPQGFVRSRWDWDHSVGVKSRFGRWQDAPSHDTASRSLLQAAAFLVQSRLRKYGGWSDRFGLVHTDLSLDNLWVDDEGVAVVGFEQSGFSWYMYDFAAAVSTLKSDARLGVWRDAWVDGYRSVCELPDDHVAMLPTFVMLRRLMLLGRVGRLGSVESREAAASRMLMTMLPAARTYVSHNGLRL